MKHRGLGNLQKMQRFETELKILNYLHQCSKHIVTKYKGTILKTQWTWVYDIHRNTGIDVKTIRRTLVRLLKEKIILETEGTHHSRLFCLSDSPNRVYVTKKTNSKQKTKKIFSHKNQLLKDSPDLINHYILYAIVEIDYLGKDEFKILKGIEITKKSYESWIRRHPRLSYIRKRLRYFQKKNIPLNPIWENIIHDPRLMKRLLKYGIDSIKLEDL